jgi:hypothetical protein
MFFTHQWLGVGNHLVDHTVDLADHTVDLVDHAVQFMVLGG